MYHDGISFASGTQRFFFPYEMFGFEQRLMSNDFTNITVKKVQVSYCFQITICASLFPPLSIFVFVVAIGDRRLRDRLASDSSSVWLIEL